MKKRNKGFTITELIATIVILAVVILLATAGYNGITKKIKETTYDNKKSLIETKATEYASNTGFTSTNVDNLVKNGYIQADDEEGNVYNPVDGSKINCKVIYINTESGNLYGNYTETEECDNSSLANENMYLKVDIYKTIDNITLGGKVEKDTWVKENVILVVNFTSTSVSKEEVEKIIWTTNTGREEVEIKNDFAEKNKYIVTAEQIVNTAYGVEVILKDGTTYQTNTNVKIDKQRPIIYENEMMIEKEQEWSNKKGVTIKASDGQGSGIYGYYIGTNNDCLHAEYEENEKEVHKKELNEEGIYYVCVRDKVGNVSEDRSSITITIEKIDKEAPSCVFSGESTTWTRENRTISLTCSDQESGCIQQNAISKVYDRNTKTEKWSYTIRDIAGNETICEKEVDVYVDKCSQTSVSYGSYGSCNRSCGGGTQQRTVYYYSSFGSGFLCSTSSQSSSCNTHACPPPPTEGSGGGDNSGNTGGGNEGPPCKNQHIVWCGGTGGPGIDSGGQLCYECD